MLISFTVIICLSIYMFFKYFFYSVFESLPALVDVNFNCYFNNDVKPLPFTDFDSTEYILAEGEAAARKREMDAAAIVENSVFLYNTMIHVVIGLTSLTLFTAAITNGIVISPVVPAYCIAFWSIGTVSATELAVYDPEITAGLFSFAFIPTIFSWDFLFSSPSLTLTVPIYIVNGLILCVSPAVVEVPV